MTVATVKARLITICEGITGVKGASREPRNITGGEMPWVVILTGPADYAKDSERYGLEVRIYHMVLIVQSWAQGPEYEAETLAEPFFERFRDEFMDNDGLDTGNNDPLDFIHNSELQHDDGVSDIILADVRYSGVDFRLLVTERFNVCKR